MRGESDDVPTQPADLKVEKTRKDIAAGGLVSFFFFFAVSVSTVLQPSSLRQSLHPKKPIPSNF